MALGKTNKTSGKSFSLKLKLKDGANFLDCAIFEIQEKVDGTYKVTGKIEDVSGDLFSLETRIFEHEKGPIRSFKLGLRDNDKDEAYFVDVGLGSNLGRGLANSILNLTAFDAVEIGLYGQKSKRDGKTYPAVAVRQGGKKDTVKWKFDPTNGGLPAPEEFKARGGKTEKDYTKVEEFLLEELKAFGATLGKSGNDRSAAAAPTKTSKTAANSEPEDDSVPF